MALRLALVAVTLFVLLVWGCTEYRSEPSCRYTADMGSGIRIESSQRRQ